VSFHNNGLVAYEGNWKSDKRHGKRTLYAAQGGLLYEGEWLEDNIFEKDKGWEYGAPRGYIEKYFEDKGFGFIIRLPDRKEIFFHSSDVKFAKNQIARGIEVEFDIVEGQKGDKAINVTIRKKNKPKYEFPEGPSKLLEPVVREKGLSSSEILSRVNLFR
jgi:cold shock CspA family protein